MYFGIIPPIDIVTSLYAENESVRRSRSEQIDAKQYVIQSRQMINLRVPGNYYSHTHGNFSLSEPLMHMNHCWVNIHGWERMRLLNSGVSHHRRTGRHNMQCWMNTRSPHLHIWTSSAGGLSVCDSCPYKAANLCCLLGLHFRALAKKRKVHSDLQPFKHPVVVVHGR